MSAITGDSAQVSAITVGNTHPPLDLGPMPTDRRMRTVDELLVRSPMRRIFEYAREVSRWPDHLPHYRNVRFELHTSDGGGIVEMFANRPFGAAHWPVWWKSEMSIDERAPSVRYRHIDGITKGMDVEWSFSPSGNATRVRIVHVWDGPEWPLISGIAAQMIIGPVFVHGIASRTLAGLAAIAEHGPAISRG